MALLGVLRRTGGCSSWASSGPAGLSARTRATARARTVPAGRGSEVEPRLPVARILGRGAAEVGEPGLPVAGQDRCPRRGRAAPAPTRAPSGEPASPPRRPVSPLPSRSACSLRASAMFPISPTKATTAASAASAPIAIRDRPPQRPRGGLVLAAGGDDERRAGEEREQRDGRHLPVPVDDAVHEVRDVGRRARSRRAGASARGTPRRAAAPRKSASSAPPTIPSSPSVCA